MSLLFYDPHTILQLLLLGLILNKSIILNIKNMNQFYNDLKKLIKNHWETIILIIFILAILKPQKITGVIVLSFGEAHYL